MNSAQTLRAQLQRIDGKGYKAYKDIRGQYHFSEFTLFIDYVQGDPFAAPSRMRVRVPQNIAQYPPQHYENNSRRVGLENYLAATFEMVIRKMGERRGSGKSGLLRIDAPGQELLARTAVSVTSQHVEIQFAVGLPAAGRRVLGRQAIIMLCDDLPKIVDAALKYSNNNREMIEKYTAVSQDGDFLRQKLKEMELIAFIANGAILPRKSGVDERPLSGTKVIPWQSPPELEVAIELPNAGIVKGTGIPTGITLIVGGGFHGKSTLLNALQVGVYNHKPGDGRELVITDPDAVKIRAEDGRSISSVDISPFINNLPFGQETTRFSSENGSGSTSQAANIIEALASGASLLLIDEDTSATNFMIRDQRMQQLVAQNKEPITPFIDRVRQLYAEHNVSTILVIGGSGDYFDVADHVIRMEAYAPHDVTVEAQQIAANFATQRQAEGSPSFGKIGTRIPLAHSLNARKGKREISIKTRGWDTIQWGTTEIDLAAIAQLVDPSQTRAIADAIQYAKTKYMDGKRPLSEIINLVMQDVERDGLAVLNGRPGQDYAAFRKHELAGAINRIRPLQIKPPTPRRGGTGG